MKKDIYCIIILAFAFLLLIGLESNANDSKSKFDHGKKIIKIFDKFQKKEVEVIEGEILVKFNESKAKATIENFHSKLRAEVISELPELGLQLVKLPEDLDIFQAIDEYNQNPNVEIAEPNYVGHQCIVPNDHFYSQQWYLPHINAEQAWDIETGNANVIIGVLDTGVDTDHPDLASKIWTNNDEIPNNNIDDDNNGYIDDVHGWDFVTVGHNAPADNDPNPEPNGIDDDNKNGIDSGCTHGTHVAGIIGAETNTNQVGVAGLAWGVTIMPIRVGDDEGSFAYWDIFHGMVYAVKNGAKIINCSFGGPYDNAYDITLSYLYNNYDCVIVAAAGNEDINLDLTPQSPVCNDCNQNIVLGVAATNSNDLKSSFSNYSSNYIDVCAPGENIFNTMFYDPSFNFNLAWDYKNGTSMSAPIVTGIAGLIRSKYPNWNNHKVIAQIINSTANIDNLNPGFEGRLGSGRVDAHAALISYSTATQLRCSAQPTTLQANGTSTSSVTTQVLDQNGNLVVDATNEITFTITSGSASGQLIGTNPVNAVNGIATITLQSTTTPGIVTIAASSPGLTSGSTIVNVYNDPTEVGGHINKDTTWPLTGSPYVVTSDLAIDAGVILTIEPGVTIKFNRDRDMNIYGALVANGTASAPITFTANATNPYPRYWGGIKFYESGLKNVSILNFCSISYGGQGGYDNFDRPLILNGYANPTITNTTMSNNNRNGIDLETGTYSSDINLNITTLPYIIRGDMAISSGATMSLQPGVLIKLESDSDIIIYGGLKARGTATQHIIFTSIRDDAHGGDSNGDGVTAGTPGDWGGIFFDNSIIDANTILDYCEIYYAGQGGYGNHDCPLELHALANPTITNTYLANNKFNGIDLRTGSYSSDILLNITNQPYMIRGDLVVESSATLTISPAVIIKFGNECDFYIRGALKAQGNNSDHIIFTSLQDDFHGGDTNANGTSVGSKGNWGGIRLYDSIIDNTTVMDYCEVMYSGCGGYGNNESPIVLDGRANPRITNSLLLNNSRNAIDLITGDYSSDFKLDILNFPYLIRGDLVIKSPAKLTILPGVILKFSSECDFYIDGSFSAMGTSSMPILFTSIKDDSIGGDSNGDGASVGTPGDWGGIGFRDASDDNLCLLDNVKIFYAGCGGYGNYAAPLAFDNASPKIQRVTIANSRSHGAICYNAASPDFGGGIQASQGQNKFYAFKNKSSKYALYNDGSADIYARNNYWDTNDSLQIEKLIYDKIDHSSKGRVYFYPFNSAADVLSPLVTVISPNGGENWIIGSKQTITWSAIDNDGISKIYLFLSRDAGVTFSKFDSLSSNPGVLNWTVSGPYSNNCKIKIQAFDFSGNMGFDVSNGNFAIVDTSGIINHPPTSPTVLLPINGEEARPDDYLVWAKSTDPDVGDVITYTLELDNNANFSSPEIHQSGISGNIMNNEAVLNQLDDNLAAEMSNAVYLQLRSLQNFNNLRDDSTYYWRVKAVDNYGAESNFTSGTSRFFFNKTNTAPQAVVAGFSPKDGIEVRTNKPEISWHPAKDADLSDHAGTLRYKLQLDDDGEFYSNYKYQYTTAMGLNTFEVPDPLSENVRWYYRVQTVDDEGLTSPWSAVQNFWVNAIDEAPRPFALHRPANSSTVTADSITFSWASTSDLDPNDKFSFTLDYSTSSSFLENVVSVPNLTDSSIAIDLKGMAKTAYYWRVKAVDSDGLVTWGSNSGSAPWQFQFNPTSVTAPEANTPKEFSLSQNHPNPFNPETIIDYQLPISCHVAITIYNTLGQEIRTLIHGEQQAGYHQLVWDGRDNSGQQVGSGIYLYQMRAGEFGALKKMVLIQ